MNRPAPTSGALRLASWTPSTDTHEIRADLRGPFFERATVEIPFPWMQPTLTRYERSSLSARLIVLWLRILASPAADHVRAATRSAFWPAVVIGGGFLGLYLLWVTRGGFVTWSGFQPIPGATR